MDYAEILTISPYSLKKEDKEKLLTERLKALTELHYNKCSSYKTALDVLGFSELSEINSYYDLPFIPVQLFKDMELKSVLKEEIFKTMTSSGTTGQAVSKIFLDRTTAANQQKTLVKIVSDFTGSSRMPMLILDCPSVIKDRAKFSARGAGILGFSIFAADSQYVFDDGMNINYEGVQTFLQKHKGKKILLFGFTFMIWQYFYKELKQSEKILDLQNSIMIHGGGWKKLEDEAVESNKYKMCLKEVCGIENVFDYYGMVEQTGCIYMECEHGHLHASIFSDVITRRSSDFSICEFGEEGIIQVVSSIPESYPGHSILTEDIGVVLGEDDCLCGRAGKYFKIIGRIKNAEIRGCSDTFEK